MYSLFEQIKGVKQLFETNGIIMQPPAMLSRVAATNPALAEAEKWWLHTWDRVRALPEHPGGGYVDDSKRVDTIFIKKSEQDAHHEEQESKRLHLQQKQAQGTTNRANQKREYEATQYAPIGKVNLLRPFSKENWANTPTEVALEEPNELDKQYEAAIDRETSLRTKTGTTETTRDIDIDRARILVLLAEQTHRLQTVGVTCPRCGTKGTLGTSDPQHQAYTQQGICITCYKCGDILVQCDTMETAGIPTELIEQAHKLLEIKRASSANLEHLLETDSKGQKRSCTTRENQITQTSFWKLERE